MFDVRGYDYIASGSPIHPNKLGMAQVVRSILVNDQEPLRNSAGTSIREGERLMSSSSIASLCDTIGLQANYDPALDKYDFAKDASVRSALKLENYTWAVGSFDAQGHETETTQSRVRSGFIQIIPK